MKQYFVVLLLSIAFVASGQDARTGQAAEFNARSITVNGKISMQVGESVVEGPKKVRLQSDNGRAEISLGAQVSVNVTPNAGGRLLRVWRRSKVDHALPIIGYQDDIDVVYVNVKAGTSFVYEDESGQTMESKSGTGRARITKEGDKLRVSFIKGNVTFERRTTESGQGTTPGQAVEFNAREVMVSGRISLEIVDSEQDHGKEKLQGDDAQVHLSLLVGGKIYASATGALERTWTDGGVAQTRQYDGFSGSINIAKIEIMDGTRFMYVNELGGRMISTSGHGKATLTPNRSNIKVKIEGDVKFEVQARPAN